jgi:lactate dehydrogenase-like 2-hydroxyacid dehydrogenase
MKVYVTRTIPDAGLSLLKQEFTVDVFPHDRLPTKPEIIAGVNDADGLLCLLTDPIDKDVITSAPRLRMIATYAVGYDNIDVATATKHGILVSNTPGVLTDATAELAWALLISAARRIPEGDTYCRQGKFTGWAPQLMVGQEITGKTLGIIGAGRIGAAMALKSTGFHMNVLYTDTQPNPTLERELHAKRVPLEELLKQADFISIHVALSPSTHHLIGCQQLQMMKPTAVLVNTSRGPVIDEPALATALKEHWIFSAGLDVYEHEPKIHKDLLTLPNVVLAPHLGSATIDTRSNMARMAAENMIAGLHGQLPPNCVNPEAYRKKP